MQPKDTTSQLDEDVNFILNRTRLDQLRKAHGIESDDELAGVIGVTRSTLYRVSEGKTVPSNGFMAKMARAFPSADFYQLFTIAPKASRVA